MIGIVELTTPWMNPHLNHIQGGKSGQDAIKYFKWQSGYHHFTDDETWNPYWMMSKLGSKS